MKNIKLPYRYDYVGSFLRPNDLKKIRADYEAGKTTYEALKEAEDTAIRDLVAKQKAAGYKLLTDGEFRRKTWYLDFMWGFEGVGHSAPKGGIPFRAKTRGKVRFRTALPLWARRTLRGYSFRPNRN